VRRRIGRSGSRQGFFEGPWDTMLSACSIFGGTHRVSSRFRPIFDCVGGRSTAGNIQKLSTVRGDIRRSLFAPQLKVRRSADLGEIR
jgi:hypothetical protein